MSAAEDERPIGDAEADRLFADLIHEPSLVLAVSGGPDSTALLYLLARWRNRHEPSPRLHAVTIDHGLRPQSRREALGVKRIAAQLGVGHRTMRWTGDKPVTGLQEKARAERYRLLLAAAQKAGARCIVTAHTLDDQAETVLLRLARGSGLAGIGAMARVVAFAGLAFPDRRAAPSAAPSARKPRGASDDVVLVRPLLDVAKARLIATLRAAGIAHVEDPSNDDPRYTRVRWRKLAPVLAAEGLTAYRLAHLARRMRRSEDAIETIVSWTAARPTASARTRHRGWSHSMRQGFARHAGRPRAAPARPRAGHEVGDEGPGSNWASSKR